MVLWIVLFLLLAGGRYEVFFTGENLAPVKDISLCAGEKVYLAYSAPDSVATVVVMLTPELEEIKTLRFENVISPSVRTFNGSVYMAGIRGESIAVKIFSSNLERIRETAFGVEEPTNVSILPYEGGILLAYVHRFLEHDLLHQDVFVKKLDFSLEEIQEVRLTDGGSWEDPSIAICNDDIFVSYGNAPLVPILDRHIVVVKLNPQLEKIAEIRYPATPSDENMPMSGATEAEILAEQDGILLFYRINDFEHSYTKLTLKGNAIFVPGNIRAVTLTTDLTVEGEFILTEDKREHFSPAATSAFGKIYFAQYFIDGDTKKLEVTSSETLEGLKVEPPSEMKGYYLAGLFVTGVIVAVMIYLRKRKKKSKKR